MLTISQCNHNQPEMESLSKPSQKIEKTKPAAHYKKPAAIPMSLSPDPAPDNPGISQPFIQGEDWLDFTLIDDPMPEMTFDDLLQSDKPLEEQQYVRNQWPWGDDADFSAMIGEDFVPQSGDQSFYGDHSLQNGPLFDHTHADASTLAFTTGNKKYPVSRRRRRRARSQRHRAEVAASRPSPSRHPGVGLQRCCRPLRWLAILDSFVLTFARSAFNLGRRLGQALMGMACYGPTLTVNSTPSNMADPMEMECYGRV